MMLRHRPMGLAVLGLATAMVAACSDSTGPTGTTQLSLSVSAPAPAVQAASGPASVVSQGDGTNELILTRVALVLRRIELERQDGMGCQESGTADGHEDDCEEFKTGPILLELPLDGAVEQVVSVDVPAATYDKLKFDIHKAGTEHSGDTAFLDANPDFENVSIRVEGTFNGEPFVYLTDLDEEQELHLEPPLQVAEGSGPSNLTLQIDVSTWFVQSDGSLVAPSTANKGGENEGLVDRNIKQSLNLFEDHDEDGHRDHD